MSNEDALIAAVVAFPDNETARLVYADWLDEHDRPEEAARLRAGKLPWPDGHADPVTNRELRECVGWRIDVRRELPDAWEWGHKAVVTGHLTGRVGYTAQHLWRNLVGLRFGPVHTPRVDGVRWTVPLALVTANTIRIGESRVNDVGTIEAIAVGEFTYDAT